jgi:hypothetical protein
MRQGDAMPYRCVREPLTADKSDHLAEVIDLFDRCLARTPARAELIRDDRAERSRPRTNSRTARAGCSGGGARSGDSVFISDGREKISPGPP